MYANLNNTTPNDPEVIIKIDISNAFNVLCRALTLDVLSGKASRTYASGIREGEEFETKCEQLRSMFGYFASMRTVKSKLRYFDFLGEVHEALGKTGGQQGDPLEMIKRICSVPPRVCQPTTKLILSRAWSRFANRNQNVFWYCALISVCIRFANRKRNATFSVGKTE